MEKVSVITPVYKSERTIIPYLDSVMNQTYDNYEVIIVIKKSQDKTEDIVKQYQKQFPKIRIIYQEEKGIGAARNKGEKHAKGSVVLMTDSDCVLHPEWIEKTSIPIIKKECDAVQGFEEDMVGTYWSKNVQHRSERNIRKILKKENQIGLIDSKNFAISTSVLKDIGYSDKIYDRSHDNSLSIKFHQKGYKLKFMPEIKVKHFHPSTLREVIKQQYDSGYHCRILTNNCKEYLREKDFLEQTNQTFTSFTRFFPGIIVEMFREPKNVPFFFVSGLAWRLGLLRGWFK